MLLLNKHQNQLSFRLHEHVLLGYNWPYIDDLTVCIQKNQQPYWHFLFVKIQCLWTEVWLIEVYMYIIIDIGRLRGSFHKLRGKWLWPLPNLWNNPFSVQVFYLILFGVWTVGLTSSNRLPVCFMLLKDRKHTLTVKCLCT